jgi:hypothetical protein
VLAYWAKQSRDFRQDGLSCRGEAGVMVRAIALVRPAASRAASALAT